MVRTIHSQPFKMKSLLILLCYSTTILNLLADDSTSLIEVFRTNYNQSTLSAAFGGVRVSYGNQNVFIWENGTGIDVVYPEGSYTPSVEPVGGFGVWTQHKINHTAVLKYGVFFPVGFNFVKGGKLPGLYGGRSSCTGGDPANDCFSTRLMWRTEGQGELYLYANRDAQDPIICEIPSNICDPEWGWSLNRGAFTFQRNVWNEIEQRLTLNTPGVRDGIISVKVNGIEIIRYDNIVFRVTDYPDITIDGLDVETFFGGNTPDWASPILQISHFSDFILLSEEINSSAPVLHFFCISSLYLFLALYIFYSRSF